MMKRVILLMILGVATTPWSVTAVYADTCQEVSGKFNEFILPRESAPNDPFGRVLGNVDGSLEGTTTAFLTSFSPGANGSVHVTTFNVFVTQEGNQLFTRGTADWAFIKAGVYQVELTLSIVGGTGKYANASGSIAVLGVGNNVLPGRPGQFVQEYRGQLCKPTR